MKKIIAGNFSSVSDAELITATLGSFPTDDLDKPPKTPKTNNLTNEAGEPEESN